MAWIDLSRQPGSNRRDRAFSNQRSLEERDELASDGVRLVDCAEVRGVRDDDEARVRHLRDEDLGRLPRDRLVLIAPDVKDRDADVSEPHFGVERRERLTAQGISLVVGILERVQEPSGLDEDDAEEPLDAEAVVAESAEGTADAIDDASAVEESGSEE